MAGRSITTAFAVNVGYTTAPWRTRLHCPDTQTRGPMGNTVLVVDDLPDARYSMGRPLATAGFDARETATGRDACGWHACGSTPSRWASPSRT